MNIVDRLFVGKIVKEFGHLDLHSFGVGKSGRSVLLVEKRGELLFVIKSFAVALFGGSVRYHTFHLPNALKLREYIDISDQVACGLILRDNAEESRKPSGRRVVKDFGCVEHEVFAIGGIDKCAKLVDSGGDLQLVLTFSMFGLSAWSLAHQYFDLEDARKLREFIDESESIAASLPPSTYSSKAEAIFIALFVSLMIAGTALLPTGGFTIAVSAVLLVNCIHQIRAFWRFPETRVYASLLMTFLALCILVVAGIKLALSLGS